MPKKLLYLLIILIPFCIFGQEVRLSIQGKITYNSTYVENVHIINKNSKKATVSNEFGEFKIPVKENDTLLFSAIQFQSKYIIITRKLIESPQQLTIILNPKINNLNEVIVKKSKNMARELGLPNAGKKPLTKIESRLNYHTKSSLPIAILAAILNKKGGINDIYYITTGNRKRDRKLQRLINQDIFNIQTEKDIEKIRIHFKDEFFSETIKIPVNEINFFIKYCLQKDIINLFYREMYIEVIDIFLAESKPYLKKIGHE